MDFGNNFDFYILTSNHEFRSSETLRGIKKDWNIVGNAKVFYFSEKDLKMQNIINKIKEIKPDAIYLNSFFSYKFLLASLIYSKKNKIKIILAPRGELCENALKIKKSKKKMYINLFKMLNLKNKIYWHLTSEDEKNNIIKTINPQKNKLKLIEVLPETKNVEISNIQKNKNELKCVFISRICEKKNLLSAIQFVKKAEHGVNLDIYGFKEDLKYWEKCEKEIKNSKNIKYCGTLAPDKVIQTFSKYQLFLFPTYSENYGHVIEEAMSGGCPVLISNKTPWNDIKNEKAGFVEDLNKPEMFTKKINEIFAMDNEEYQKIRKNAVKYIKNKFNYDEILKKYEEMFR